MSKERKQAYLVYAVTLSLVCLTSWLVFVFGFIAKESMGFVLGGTFAYSSVATMYFIAKSKD